jgi:putative flippase GtrA
MSEFTNKPNRVIVLYRVLFVDKAKSGFVQFFRYGFVGGFSAIVDIGSLYILTSYFHVFYLLSAAIAFILGTIVNYLLSVAWVFQRSGKIRVEFALFTLIGLGGLCLNELIIWFCVSKLGLYYLVAKLIAVSVVVIWSFALRRALFQRLNLKKPETISILSDIE